MGDYPNSVVLQETNKRTPGKKRPDTVDLLPGSGLRQLSSLQILGISQRIAAASAELCS